MNKFAEKIKPTKINEVLLLEVCRGAEKTERSLGRDSSLFTEGNLQNWHL